MLTYTHARQSRGAVRATVHVSALGRRHPKPCPAGPRSPQQHFKCPLMQVNAAFKSEEPLNLFEEAGAPLEDDQQPVSVSDAQSGCSRHALNLLNPEFHCAAAAEGNHFSFFFVRFHLCASQLSFYSWNAGLYQSRLLLWFSRLACQRSIFPEALRECLYVRRPWQTSVWPSCLEDNGCLLTHLL